MNRSDLLVCDIRDLNLNGKESKIPVEDEDYHMNESKQENLLQTEDEDIILEPLTIIPSPEPDPVIYIFYNSRGLSDFRFSPYTKRTNGAGDTEAPNSGESRAPPLVWIKRAGDGLSRIEVNVKWAENNELRIGKTQLAEDAVLEMPSKIQLFIQLDPNVKEFKSFLADVKTVTGQDSVTRKSIGPIVIFLKAELAESQEEKILGLTTMEERTAAHNLVDKKELGQLTRGMGPHQDTVLAILCAQRQPPEPGRNLAQILAVLKRLSSSPDPTVRATITRVNNNELSALEIAAIMNNAVVASYIVEVIYNMTDSLEAALEAINSRDSQGNSILHLLARKGDTNIQTLRSLLSLRLTDWSPLVRMLPNLKHQFPVHIAAQSKDCQLETLRTIHENMNNCFEVCDNDGMTALHYACQRSNDMASISTILSYHKVDTKFINTSYKVSFFCQDNINAVSKDGLTALDHLTRREVTGGLSQHQKADMVKLIKNNGGR